jgi:hypothetical protein
MLTINDETTTATHFAYDSCHKIYLLEDDQDLGEARDSGYDVIDICNLKEAYNNSCELRFISNWKLDKKFVEQFEEAEFSD